MLFEQTENTDTDDDGKIKNIEEMYRNANEKRWNSFEFPMKVVSAPIVPISDISTVASTALTSSLDLSTSKRFFNNQLQNNTINLFSP